MGPFLDKLFDEYFILEKLSGKASSVLDIHGEFEEAEFLVFLLEHLNLQLFHLEVLPKFEDFLLIAIAIEFGLFSGLYSKLLIE